MRPAPRGAGRFPPKDEKHAPQLLRQSRTMDDALCVDTKQRCVATFDMLLSATLRRRRRMLTGCPSKACTRARGNASATGSANAPTLAPTSTIAPGCRRRCWRHSLTTSASHHVPARTAAEMYRSCAWRQMRKILPNGAPGMNLTIVRMHWSSAAAPLDGRGAVGVFVGRAVAIAAIAGAAPPSLIVVVVVGGGRCAGSTRTRTRREWGTTNTNSKAAVMTDDRHTAKQRSRLP